MMDAELKKKLIEAIEKAYEETQRPCPMGDKKVAQGDVHFASRATFVCRNRTFFLPKRQKAQALVFAKAITNLVNARFWGKIERALAEEAVERMIADLVRRRQRSTEDEAQLPLPGFEYLPKRIPNGRRTLAFAKATVAQFLIYKADYEKRAEKDQHVVEELRRLANKVARFAQDEANLTVGEALDRVNKAGAETRLVVMSPSPR